MKESVQIRTWGCGYVRIRWWLLRFGLMLGIEVIAIPSKDALAKLGNIVIWDTLSPPLF